MANTEPNTKTAKNKKFQNQPARKLIGFCFLLIGAVAISQINFDVNVAEATSTAALFPAGIGNFDAWTANTGTKLDAVSGSDSDDTTFIRSTSTSAATQTFSFPGAAVPAGALINSVTLTALAKVDSGFGGIQLLAENGTGPSDSKTLGLPHTLSNTAVYAPVSHAMVNNPFTNAPWTVADVNTWAMNFGVANVSLFDGAKVTQISLSVDYTVHPTPAPNPALAAQICGLDIALVLDNSGSIGGNLPIMKSSFNGFVSSLLPATPTDFSVTYFDGTAHYAQQAFSNNATATVSAINSVPPSSGQTDWEDALIKAAATFDPRPGNDHPNLIIFASDGQPNRYGLNGSLGVGGTVDQNALDAAITEANIIKSAGTRIITLGIGSGVIQANMEAISSSDAYFSVGNFNQLSATLQTIAGNMCGSTITVSKKIDADGNLSTTNDQTNGGAGFTFDISPGFTGQVTDVNGQTPAVAVAAGTYTVAEAAIPAGFSALGGSCSGATNNGTASGTGVSGLQVNGNDIVACTFYNKPLGTGGGGATSSDISIVKTADKATANEGDTVKFTLVVKNNGPDAATGVVASDTLPSALTFVSATSTVGSFNASTSLWSIGSLANGASATTTVTATINPGTAGQVLSNTATVSSATNDPNSGNNTSTAGVGVNSPGGCTVNCGGGGNSTSTDLSIVKTVDRSSVNQGDAVTYTLVVKNSGPDTATGVTATDTLPSAITFVSATSTQGSYNATSSIWAIGTLLNGASATTTITGIVNSAAAGQTITNNVSVIAATLDPDLSNNSSSASSSVPNPGGGGCTVNCGGGGGSGSGGGGGGGGNQCPNGICGYGPFTGSGGTPQVLGANTGGGTPGGGSGPGSGGNNGQVEGANTTLPRTGMPIGFELLLLAAAAAVLNKKLKLI